LLALSASRAGWLIAASGLIAGALVAKKQRFRLVLALLTVGLVGAVLAVTPLGEPFKRGWDRTFGANRDASAGRSDQWRVFYRAFTDSPSAVLLGYGPGNGRSVFAKFSYKTPGIERALGALVPFHALIMHMGAALGLLGLIPMAIWEAGALWHAWSQFSQNKLILPVVGFLGFFLASLTVTGFDTISGSLLGLALINVNSPRLIRRRLSSGFAHRKLVNIGPCPLQSPVRFGSGNPPKM
jgi:O-antigen ligase